MEVILLEKISKLGNIGETVRVKDGFARNYLIPKKAAIRATEENKKVFEGKKEQLEKANLEKIKVAKKQLSSIPKNVVIFREASEQGALFGSVTTGAIRCGMPSYKLNSTFFGSIIRNFTSSGLSLVKFIF
mgnify:CR=1 FL=1